MRFLVTLLVLFLVIQSSGARSAEFVWSPQSGNSGNGSLYLIGPIIPGDYERFVEAIRSRGPHPFTLYLRSGGGNVLEAMKIGRLVRELTLTVFTPLSSPANINRESCSFDDQDLGRQVPCICASACTLIYFGGVNRVGLAIYIHSIAYEKSMFGSLSPEEAEQMYQQAMRDVRSYLTEMDVPDKYYYMMVETASANLTRVPLPLGGSDIAGWTPGYREWLYAKCGNPPANTAMAQAWAQCSLTAQNEAQVEAIKRLVVNGQQE